MPKAVTYTTHNKHNRRTQVLSAGLEIAIPATEWPQTCSTATASGHSGQLLAGYFTRLWVSLKRLAYCCLPDILSRREPGLCTYRTFQEESAMLRENFPLVKLHRCNWKYIYPKLKGYGDNVSYDLKNENSYVFTDYQMHVKKRRN